MNFNTELEVGQAVMIRESATGRKGRVAEKISYHGETCYLLQFDGEPGVSQESFFREELFRIETATIKLGKKAIPFTEGTLQPLTAAGEYYTLVLRHADKVVYKATLTRSDARELTSNPRIKLIQYTF